MLIIGLTLFNVTIAQVAINSDGANPNASAMLDISSSQKGLLIPRMTATQRDNIQNPTPGLLVYVTNAQSFWYYHTSAWHEIDVFDGTFGSPTTSQVQVEESADEDIIRFDVNGTERMTMDDSRVNFKFGTRFFIGREAGHLSYGLRNVGIGEYALGDLSQSVDIVAIGIGAFQYPYPSGGTTNGGVAIGLRARNTSTTGVSIGDSSGFNSTYHFNSNVSIGNKALLHNMDGKHIVAIGNESLSNNVDGDNNTAVGLGSLKRNTNGSDNIAIGIDALNMNVIGYDNIAIGNEALMSNGFLVVNSYDGIRNIAIGAGALHENISGVDNIAVGDNALYNIALSGDDCIAIGSSCMKEAVDGDNTIAVGRSALSQSTKTDYNLAFGFEALISDTGMHCSAFGYQALYNNISGADNSAVGYKALFNNETGSYNTAIGYNCGPGSTQPGLTNSTAIGNGAINTASYQVRLGNSSVNSIGGYVGWSVISDGRFKNSVKMNVAGLDFIMKLNPVTYRLNIMKINKFLNTESTNQLSNELSSKVQTGFVAQEVESAAINLGYEFNGIDAPKNMYDHYSLRYSTFVVPLVEAIQEQQKTIASQDQEIDELLRKIELFNVSK